MVVVFLISDEKKRVFIIMNPIAGMGGRVGLKGTDGVLEEAKKRGAKPVSPMKLTRFLAELTKNAHILEKLQIYGINTPMGEDEIKKFGSKLKYSIFSIVSEKNVTDANDTKKAAQKALEYNADLVVFVGGDGTARDIYSVVEQKLPILGIPSGVKMYSGVFARTPHDGAELLKYFILNRTEVIDAEIMDIDENAFRHDEIKIKLFGIAKTIQYKNLSQCSKIATTATEKDNQEAMAQYFVDEIMETEVCYILGPGSTIYHIKNLLNLPKKTKLGVDVIYVTPNGNIKLLAHDANEAHLKKIIDNCKKVKVVLTPIGGQGFLFGRGNQQISEEILRKINKEDLIVLATKKKLHSLFDKKLYIDIDDEEVAKKFVGYIRVLTDYNEFFMIKIVA